MKPPIPFFDARRAWLSLTPALALCVAVSLWPAGAAIADQPLEPPSDFVQEFAEATVTGDVARNRTTITVHATPGATVWTIPVWTRAFLLGPDARSILVLNPGGNLLSSADPAQIVATVWYLEGTAVQRRPFRLDEVMDPASLETTVSHFRWLESLSLGPDGYRLDLVGGRRITLTFR